MIDNLPPEVGLPIAAVLWVIVAYPAAKRFILGRKVNK